MIHLNQHILTKAFGVYPEFPSIPVGIREFEMELGATTWLEFAPRQTQRPQAL